MDFDRAFIEKTYTVVGLDKEKPTINWIDSQDLFKCQLFKKSYPKYLKSFKMEALCNYYGVINEHSHLAREDTITLFQLLMMMSENNYQTILNVCNKLIYPPNECYLQEKN